MSNSTRTAAVSVFALAVFAALVPTGLSSSAEAAGELPLSGIVIPGFTGTLDDDLSLDTAWDCRPGTTLVGVELYGPGLTTSNDILAPVAYDGTNAPADSIGGFHLNVGTSLAELFAANGVDNPNGDYSLAVSCGVSADYFSPTDGKRLRFTSDESGTTYVQVEPVKPVVSVAPAFESPVVYDPGHPLHFIVSLDPSQAQGGIDFELDDGYVPGQLTSPAPVLDRGFALSPGTHSLTAMYLTSYWYAYRFAQSQPATVVVAGPARIKGTTSFGSSVTCVGVSGATRTFTWILDGKRTSALRSAKVKVPLSWVGHSLGCKIKTADADSSVTVASPTQIVRLAHAPINYTSPSVRGVARRGEVLTCSPGVWDPKPASFTYRWLRNGKPLYGADASHRTVTSGDRGQLLSCVVHTHLAGHLVGRAQAPARRVSDRP